MRQPIQNKTSEEHEQIKLVEWLRLKKIPHFHPRNEGKHTIQYMKKSKAMGLYSGVPDLFVYLPTKLLAIEMKQSPKIMLSGKESVSHLKVSDSQQDWIDTINMYDYAEAKVCYGFNQAMDFVIENM